MVLRWSLAGFNVVYDRIRKGRWSWGEGVGAFGKEKTARKLPNFSSVRESETNILAVAANGQVVVGYVGEDKKERGQEEFSQSRFGALSNSLDARDGGSINDDAAIAEPAAEVVGHRASPVGENHLVVSEFLQAAEDDILAAPKH